MEWREDGRLLCHNVLAELCWKMEKEENTIVVGDESELQGESADDRDVKDGAVSSIQ